MTCRLRTPRRPRAGTRRAANRGTSAAATTPDCTPPASSRAPRSAFLVASSVLSARDRILTFNLPARCTERWRSSLWSEEHAVLRSVPRATPTAHTRDHPTQADECFRLTIGHRHVNAIDPHCFLLVRIIGLSRTSTRTDTRRHPTGSSRRRSTSRRRGRSVRNGRTPQSTP
jgi:hypothetical protein